MYIEPAWQQALVPCDYKAWLKPGQQHNMYIYYKKLVVTY